MLSSEAHCGMCRMCDSFLFLLWSPLPLHSTAHLVATPTKAHNLCLFTKAWQELGQTGLPRTFKRKGRSRFTGLSGIKASNSASKYSFFTCSQATARLVKHVSDTIGPLDSGLQKLILNKCNVCSHICAIAHDVDTTLVPAS